jgi:hypothetical protein
MVDKRHYKVLPIMANNQAGSVTEPYNNYNQADSYYMYVPTVLNLMEKVV